MLLGFLRVEGVMELIRDRFFSGVVGTFVLLMLVSAAGAAAS